MIHVAYILALVDSAGGMARLRKSGLANNKAEEALGKGPLQLVRWVFGKM